MLKIVAYKCTGGHIGNVNPNDVPNKEKDNNNWWYLHGELKNEIGFDKGVMINCYSEGLSKKTVRWGEIRGGVCTKYSEGDRYALHANGVYEVEVIGINRPCKAFLWTTSEYDVKYDKGTFPYWMQRGLVCFADDIESCRYAISKMKEKSSIL